MYSHNHVIVRVEQAYINEENSIIVNSTVDDVSSIQREAVVISAPENTVLKEGYKVIVHHNIFRSKNDYKGNLCPSDYNIEGNVYFVPLSEIFMYSSLEKYTEALNPYVFVKPIDLDESSEDLIGVKKEYKGKEQRVGKIKYINKDLIEQGLSVGDLVKFKKNSEYEFNINGELLYKMKTKDILLKLK